MSTTKRAPAVTIGNRYPREVADAVAADAERLGLTQTEYMHMAVDKMLKRKITPEQSSSYRRPPTRAELREQARREREERERQEEAPVAAKAPAKATKPAKAAKEANEAKAPTTGPPGGRPVLARATVQPRFKGGK